MQHYNTCTDNIKCLQTQQISKLRRYIHAVNNIVIVENTASLRI